MPATPAAAAAQKAHAKLEVRSGPPPARKAPPKGEPRHEVIKACGLKAGEWFRLPAGSYTRRSAGMIVGGAKRRGGPAGLYSYEVAESDGGGFVVICDPAGAPRRAEKAEKSAAKPAEPAGAKVQEHRDKVLRQARELVELSAKSLRVGEIAAQLGEPDGYLREILTEQAGFKIAPAGWVKLVGDRGGGA